MSETKDSLRATAPNDYMGAALEGIDATVWPGGEPMVDLALMHRRKVATNAATAVLAAVWERAQKAYGEPTRHKYADENGTCNACVLEALAEILGRPKGEGQ